MSKSLQDKVAFITGGARGIGRAIALRLAEQGASIVLNYYNSSDVAEELVARLREMGVEAIAVQGNVSDASSIKEMLAEIKQHFDRIDILVNNAASGVLKPVMKMSTKHWRWCLETNALALALLAKEVTPIMPAGGRILALSSLGAARVIPDYGFIGASKAALESLVRTLSVELAPKGISVNTISAGAVDTDALKMFPARERLLKESEQRSLAGRNITPDDVANVAYLLCRPEAEMIRGQTIFVDAGYSIIA